MNLNVIINLISIYEIEGKKKKKNVGNKQQFD